MESKGIEPFTVALQVQLAALGTCDPMCITSITYQLFACQLFILKPI